MSIKTQALIVSVNINQPTKARTDRKASDDIASANNASRDAVRLIKNLYPAALLAPIDKVVGQARAFIRNDTYMWDRNEYLLPIARFMYFASRAGEIELEFEQAVTAFLNNWANVMLNAQTELGGLHDANAYPDVATLRQEFRLKFNYRQVTDDRDFRVQMQEDELNELKRLTEANVREQYSGLAQAPIKALTKELDNLRETMRRPDREITDSNGILVDIKPPIFKNSAFDNVIDECNKIMDFGDDILLPEAVAMAIKIKHELPSADEARKSKTTRFQVANLVDGWIDTLNASMPGHIPEQVTEPNPMGLTETPEQLPDLPELIEIPEQDPYALESNPTVDLMHSINDMFGDDL